MTPVWVWLFFPFFWKFSFFLCQWVHSLDTWIFSISKFLIRSTLTNNIHNEIQWLLMFKSFPSICAVVFSCLPFVLTHAVYGYWFPFLFEHLGCWMICLLGPHVSCRICQLSSDDLPRTHLNQPALVKKHEGFPAADCIPTTHRTAVLLLYICVKEILID